jgi:hypothetical protein
MLLNQATNDPTESFLTRTVLYSLVKCLHTKRITKSPTSSLAANGNGDQRNAVLEPIEEVLHSILLEPFHFFGDRHIIIESITPILYIKFCIALSSHQPELRSSQVEFVTQGQAISVRGLDFPSP